MKKIIITYKKEHHIRERILLGLLGIVLPIHAAFYVKRKPWGITTEELILYPQGTLGHELGRFLTQEKLQPIDRVERHDAFHILLGFTTKTTDEAAMQYFLIGNGKGSPFTVGTAIFAGMILPEKLPYFLRQYQRGKRAISIAKWNFKDLLGENYEELKSYIFHKPVNNPFLVKKLENYSPLFL